MEERPSDTSLDSLCYVSNHVGFYGTIKHSPADFVVTEIDVTGHLVTADHIKQPKQQVRDNDNEPQVKKQKADLREVQGRTVSGGQAGCKDVGEPLRDHMDDAFEVFSPLGREVQGRTVPGQARCKGVGEPLRDHMDVASEVFSPLDSEGKSGTIPGQAACKGVCDSLRDHMDNAEVFSPLDSEIEGGTIPKQARFKGVGESLRNHTDDASEVFSPLDFEAGLYSLLNLLLSADVQKALNNFANSVKSAFESQVNKCELCELSLGVFSCKDDRAILHRSVRQTFPFLVTFTKNTELLVKPNLDYQELSRLTSEEEAGKFFTFLDAKVKNSTFTFQPDVSKEHRTSVHHFISRKFGKLVETKSFSEKVIDGVQRVSITVRFREKKSSSGKRQRTEEHSQIFTGRNESSPVTSHRKLG